MLGICPVNLCPINVLPINIDAFEICKHIKYIITKFMELKSDFTKEYTCCVGPIYAYIETNDISSTMANIHDHKDPAMKDAIGNLHKALRNTYIYIANYTQKTHIRCINHKKIIESIDRQYNILRKRMEVFKFNNIVDSDLIVDKINACLCASRCDAKEIKNECACERAFDIIINRNDDTKCYNFENCKIVAYHVGDKQYDTNNLLDILKRIYDKIDNGLAIIKSTKLDIKTIPTTNYCYLEHIGIAVPPVGNNKLIDEIVTQATTHNIKLTIKLILSNDSKIIIDV